MMLMTESLNVTAVEVSKTKLQPREETMYTQFLDLSMSICKWSPKQMSCYRSLISLFQNIQVYDSKLRQRLLSGALLCESTQWVPFWECWEKRDLTPQGRKGLGVICTWDSASTDFIFPETFQKWTKIFIVLFSPLRLPPHFVPLSLNHALHTKNFKLHIQS